MGTASAVANEFINLCDTNNIELTNMKLVKLIYIAQGLSLALLNRPIFKDDKIEAWKYGPVIPSIYHEFKHYKSNPITSKSLMLDGNWEASSEPKLTNPEDKKIVRLTWNLYKNSHGKELAASTHRTGTPWSLTYQTGANNTINNELIKRYYDKFIVNLEKHLKNA